jgi:hypothetical protein
VLTYKYNEGSPTKSSTKEVAATLRKPPMSNDSKSTNTPTDISSKFY